MHISSPLMFLFITTIFYRFECAAKDSINARSPLVDDGHDTLVSAGNKFELGFFTPQGSDKSSNRYVGIWYYNKFIPRTVVWVANRDDPLVGPCGLFGVADDGNLKIWCRTSRFVFDITSLDESTRTSNTTVQLLDSGNLVFVDGQTGTRLWQSFDHPTDTFLPGMNMKNNKNMELTCWNSPTDPARGNFTFRQDQEGAYSIQKRSSVYWKSGEPGPFSRSNELPSVVAQILSDSPDTELDQKISQRPTNRSSITFPNSTRPSYYNNSRLLMNSSGEIQYYYILVEGESWLLSLSEPQTRCSEYGVCGNFGICNVKSDPICHCLPGFQPASSADWHDGQYSDGCVRMGLLICRQNQTDRFVNVSFVSQIGSQVQPFDRAQEEAECQEECLNNCKCEAYLWYVALTDRETGQSVAKCWIWSDLVNLRQDYSESRLNLSLRIRSSARANSATRICQPCVAKSIPYPLSVGPNCGDPLYDSFQCNNSTGEIRFLALSGKYQVTDIYQEKRQFVILVGDSKGADCNATKLSSQSLKLNQSLPFTVTNWCYTTVDPSNSSHIEIGWEPPLEPTCDSSVDCKDWPDSDCRDKSNNGQRRCYCNQNYQWDDSSASCVPAWANSHSQRYTKSRITYLIVFPILVVGVVLAICSYILYRRKRTGNRGSSEARPVLFSHESNGQVNDLMHENNQGSIDVPFYNLDTVLSATNKFSDANMLGRGGFGPVYKGMFPGGREIAVKRLSSFSGQGMEEFRNEVMLIAKLQHRNLVRLLGYCTTENEKILLYEYMPNRSLDAFLFDQHSCLLLDWDKRFNIILGIARGLLYLHQDSRLRIIHRDLKTSNILLDEDMNPKISDFGLARIVQGKGTEASTNKVVGTYGYMSPEYALDGKFSTKSDVFSFGVVMLEIISGKKNTGFYNPQQVLNLLGYAWGLWIENKALDLADPTVLESCEESQVIIKCINVGLLCVQEDPNDRPSMSTVVVMLGSENTSPLPLPNQPAFVVRKRLSTTSSSTSTKPDTFSNNELTVSMADGR